VLIAFAFYDLVGHRWLIWEIDGERASMAYQIGTVTALFWHPAVLLTGTISVFADVFGRLAGDLSTVFSLLLMLALISAWWVPGAISETQAEGRLLRLLQTKYQRPFIRVLLGGFLMIGCLYGMIARHHPIMRSDVRSAEYVLPLTVVFLLFLGISAAMLVTKKYPSRGILQMILVVLVASNLVFVVSERVFNHVIRLQMRCLLHCAIRPHWLRDSQAIPIFPA
jgi:hypothetical protein